MTEFFISTPIYYVNDAPHLGHAYSMINADAFARWHRGLGDDVFFLTGTDEHGQKVADSAARNNVSVEAWTDTYSERFKAAWIALRIDYDDFIRTTEERHTKAVQKFLQAIYDRGYIYKGMYRGTYCVSCEAYYTANDAPDGNCPVHKRPLIEMEEENYFFRLSAFQEALIEWYDREPDAVFPDFRRNEAYSFIKGGLEDISISRTSIDWGIPLPWDERHVCYVWFDALINYVTATGYAEDFERFSRLWRHSHHLIGKDIIRFHCVWWPAMLMAAGLEPPSKLLVHGWLLVKGEKMAKSGGNGVDPIELVGTYGTDAVRYYLLREHALGADGDFSVEALEHRYNVELANNIGNLLSRVTNVVARSLGGIAPAYTGRAIAAERIEPHVARAQDGWNGFATAQALEEVQAMVRLANAVLEERAPWKAADPGEAAEPLGDALEILRLVAVLVAPVLTEASPKILAAIGIDPASAKGSYAEALGVGQYVGGASIAKAAPLFPRLEAAGA